MQAAERNELAFCKQVMEAAGALRAGLHTRAQVVHLVKAPVFASDPVDLGLLNQSLDVQVTAVALVPASVIDSGVQCDAHHIGLCLERSMAFRLCASACRSPLHVTATGGLRCVIRMSCFKPGTQQAMLEAVFCREVACTPATVPPACSRIASAPL